MWEGEKGIRKLGQIDEVDIFVVALLKDFFFLLAGVPCDALMRCRAGRSGDGEFGLVGRLSEMRRA